MNKFQPILGEVNKILPSSFVDGPGNRAVVFLQGCNMHCLYCHNPFTINRCRHCSLCVDECPSHALAMVDGHVCWNPAVCEDCDTCIEICPYFSSPKVRKMTPEELWDEIRLNMSFLAGVTVSGGEPGLQIPFLEKSFSIIKNDSQLTTLIETNGLVGPKACQPLLPFLDMAIVDLKCADDLLHKELTGESLGLILETIEFFWREKKLYAIQQVITPGFTSSIIQVENLARMIRSISPEIPLKLLRFRPHGTRGEAKTWPSPSDDEMNQLAAAALNAGLQKVTRSL